MRRGEPIASVRVLANIARTFTRSTTDVRHQLVVVDAPYVANVAQPVLDDAEILVAHGGLHGCVRIRDCVSACI